MFRFAFAVVFFIAIASAFAAEPIPIEVEDDDMVPFQIDRRLIIPLVYSKSSPALVAITYEYCLGMSFGAEYANSSYEQYRAMVQNAKDLTAVLSENNHPIEAAFFADCSFKKGKFVARRKR